MALTPDIIKKRFPEMSLVSDERIEMSILEATIIMGDDVDRWFNQETYYMANGYLIAHLLSIAQAQWSGDDNSLAPIKGSSVDNVEIEYARTSTPTFIDTELSSTSYGMRYLFYRNMCFTGGVCA